MAKKSGSPSAAPKSLPQPLLKIDAAHKHCVTSVAFFPSGLHLAAGSQDGVVRLWDVVTGKRIKAFPRTSARWAVSEIACSGDGCTVAVVRTSQKGDSKETKTGQLWNVMTSEIKRIDDPNDPYKLVLRSPTFAPSGAFVAVTGQHLQGERIQLFDPQSGKPEGPGCANAKCTVVAVSPHGAKIASGNGDGVIAFWDGPKEVGRTTHTHSRGISHLAFSDDGKQIASASDDRTIRIWDVGTGKELRKWTGTWKFTLALRFLPGHLGLLGVNEYDGKGSARIGLFDGEEKPSEHMIGKDVFSADVTRDGTRLATGHSSGGIRLWDLPSLLKIR